MSSLMYEDNTKGRENDLRQYEQFDTIEKKFGGGERCFS